MKFKFLLLFLLISCTSELNQTVSRSTYTSSGFAYIYNESDRVKKITSKKFNNEELLIGHNKLRAGKLLKITNPENKKSIVLKIKKKTKYPDFYKILLTESLANRLELNNKIPFVEIQEVKKNKSFIAEKAKTFEEEKKVVNKVPVKDVKIHNISKIKSSKKPNIKNFLIIIAEFYSTESALFLKEKVTKEMTNFNSKKLSIKNKGKNSFQLVSGPYNAVNSLKNDYIVLKKYGFEELDVKLLNE